MTPEKENEIEKRLVFLEKENKRLDTENKAFIKLINDHAGFINKNSAEIKNVDKFLRAELQKIASAIKKVANRR
ncbi:MAG: hypothetical protein U9Q83_07520 [Bacteroidota bacterium]|nr:hypothetical protein [Bacteroidota bacterium]